MYVNFSELKGKVLKDVIVIDNDEIVFICDDDTQYKMYHNQDCCESVTIDDIKGNLKDLIGKEILKAEEKINNDRDEYYDSFTWSFYDIETIDEHIQIKWYGTSNGYYSETVDFELVEEECERYKYYL
jgi:hypothetical protein